MNVVEYIDGTIKAGYIENSPVCLFTVNAFERCRYFLLKKVLKVDTTMRNKSGKCRL